MTLNEAFVLGLHGAILSLECLLTFCTLDTSLASLLSWFFSRLTWCGQEEEKGEGGGGPLPCNTMASQRLAMTLLRTSLGPGRVTAP